MSCHPGAVQLKMGPGTRKPVFVVPTRSHKNRSVQIQMAIARGFKFRIWEVEGIYYPYICIYSEKEGADHLRGYRVAELRLCFSHMQKSGFVNKRLISNTDTP